MHYNSVQLVDALAVVDTYQWDKCVAFASLLGTFSAKSINKAFHYFANEVKIALN
jgi:hypothetical protein